MKKYFAHLRPLERRLAVGVAVILILVLNWWLIWRLFRLGEFAAARGRRAPEMALYQSVIRSLRYRAGEEIGSQGEICRRKTRLSISCAPSSHNPPPSALTLTVIHAPQCTRTSFHEQTKYQRHPTTNNRGLPLQARLRASMVRWGSGVAPDGAKQHLNANIRLVASYQKTRPASLKSTPQHQ